MDVALLFFDNVKFFYNNSERFLLKIVIYSRLRISKVDSHEFQYTAEITEVFFSLNVYEYTQKYLEAYHTLSYHHANGKAIVMH